MDRFQDAVLAQEAQGLISPPQALGLIRQERARRRRFNLRLPRVGKTEDAYRRPALLGLLFGTTLTLIMMQADTRLVEGGAQAGVLLDWLPGVVGAILAMAAFVLPARPGMTSWMAGMLVIVLYVFVQPGQLYWLLIPAAIAPALGLLMRAGPTASLIHAGCLGIVALQASYISDWGDYNVYAALLSGGLVSAIIWLRSPASSLQRILVTTIVLAGLLFIGYVSMGSALLEGEVQGFVGLAVAGGGLYGIRHLVVRPVAWSFEWTGMVPAPGRFRTSRDQA